MASVVTLIILSLFLSLSFFARWYQHREIQRRQADLDLFGQRNCPTCRQEYGESVRYVRYAHSAAVNQDAGEFISDVILICPHCGYMNVFDHEGSHRPAFECHFESSVAELQTEGS